jgi:transposase-like protein
MNELKNRAVDAQAAEVALTAFEASEWGRRYPAISQSWRRAWAEVIPFFAFPAEVRKIIYTTDEMDKTRHTKMCYGDTARATPWRRAEPRL